MTAGPAAIGVSDRRELVLHADVECGSLHERPRDLVSVEVWDSLDLQAADWLPQEEHCRLCATRLPAWGAAVDAVPWRRRRLVPIRDEGRAPSEGR